MKKYKDIMVGLNSNNEIVFISSLELEERNIFSTIFQGFAIECPNSENKVVLDYVECLLEDLDKEDKYDRCEWYDCSPSELCGCIAEDMTIYDVYDVMEKYDGEIYYEDEFGNPFQVYLDFTFSTPRDYEEDNFGKITTFVNTDIERLFNKINELGKYHLKEIPLTIWEELENEIEKYVSYKERFLEDVEFVKSMVKKIDMGEC